ncbi:MAG TPA: GNAT family protein [Caulobacteraceae bacterium]|jgi:RimJ/RimL family protein N-acetyltransferase|nr:GNAT family protein [Caulobacteraceae bacterium]
MSPTPWPPEITLEGRHAILAPLSLDHAEALAEAVKDGELWKLWYTGVASPDGMVADIEGRLGRRAVGAALPFTVIARASGKPVGMTTYMNLDRQTPRVEIGATWYRASVQRTSINTECKLMLLGHAFEALACPAVEFRTHFLNHQSRRAIERLGAKLDGVLRNHVRMPDGTLRDTCVYSILESEWPTVRRHLQWQLEKAR